MSTEITEDSREEPTETTQRIETVLGSPLILSVLFGVVLIVAGLIRGEGAVAGMLGVYGATVLLVAAIVYVTLAILRRNQ